MAFIGTSPLGSTKKQTIFKQTITGNGGTQYTLTYRVGSATELQVYLNDVRLNPDVDYTAGASTITFTNPVLVSDECWLVYAGSTLSTISIAEVSPEELSTGGPAWDTSGNVTIAGTVNGRNMATDGNKLDAINQGLSTTDTPTFAGVNQGNITTTATSKTLVNGEFCNVTAATQTITLPESPSAGDNVTISVGNFTDTAIARNGANIVGLAENLTIDVANAGITLVYSGDATQGWRII